MKRVENFSIENLTNGHKDHYGRMWMPRIKKHISIGGDNDKN
jgi:hypothetical protein